MTKISIPDMSCGHCKASVDTAIKAIDPAANIDFDMPARTISLQTQASVEAVQIALLEAGYTSTAV
jgi:copper chaperone